MGLGFGEILIIVLVITVVFGPQRIPELSRAIGRGLREFRKAMRDIETQIEAGAEPPRQGTEEVKPEAASTAKAAEGQTPPAEKPPHSP